MPNHCVESTSLKRRNSRFSLEIARMATRYYLHGDRGEREGDAYYCAFCDAFKERAHFEHPSPHENHQERYLRSLQGLKTLTSSSRSRYSRPASAENLFAGLPKPAPPKQSRFYRWLVRQTDRNDPIGDLAGDVRGDASYPSSSEAISAARSYLINRKACDEALQALTEAWAEFKAKSPKRDGLSLKLRFEVLRSNGYRCQLCGATAGDGARLEVDHKVPVAKGGTDDPENLWTLCFGCNRGKGVRDL